MDKKREDCLNLEGHGEDLIETPFRAQDDFAFR